MGNLKKSNADTPRRGDYPSMQTWQADTYATWAILGEIVAGLDLFDKIDWDGATKRAQAKCGDQMHHFIWQSVNGVREAAAKAEAEKRRDAS